MVFTVGDSRHPLRILISNGQVYASRPHDAAIRLGESLPAGEWQVITLAVATATGHASIALDGSAAVSVALGELQSVWMYLGQGYRTSNADAYSRTQCAEFDLLAMDTRVSIAAL